MVEPPGRRWCARIAGAQPGARGDDGVVKAAVTRALVTTLTTITHQIKVLEAEIAVQLAAHPDAHIFTSLPGTGTLRPARLLGEIGDCRARYPDEGCLMSLAGVVPVTRRSGRHHSVAFRWAVNKELRDAVTDFAGASRHANPWAAHVYDQARARGKDHPHEVRILGQAWLRVIWRCWHDGVAYDPDKHRALQQLLSTATHGDDQAIPNPAGKQ